MKVSILISSYNKDSYIEKCIQSCLSQTYKDFEVILLDNFSTDNTDLILEKYKKKILIKKEKKISDYSTVNQMDVLKKAFSISTGEIICLLDADDYFENNKLEIINKIFLQNKDKDVIFEKPRVLFNNNFTDYKIKKKFSNYIWPTSYQTSSISIRRSFFDKFFREININSYPLLEIDFRITCISTMIYKNFLNTDETLTIYRKVTDGIMSNIKKFSNKWWVKRLEAHYFINDICNKNQIIHKKNYDFYLTKIIVSLLNIKRMNK